MARKPEPTISAVLIVKDEEDCLARSLASVTWADEIVVYDTGSTDRTVEIARQFTDKVIEGYWNDDFGDARNRALAHATSEWALTVDADETIEGNTRAVRKHLASGKANFYSIPIVTRVARPGLIDPPATSVRLFMRADGRYAGALHEQVVERPGVRRISRPLPGVVIKHSGYAEGPDAMRVRASRNLEIAERELEAAKSAVGMDRHGLALRQANLARALSGAGRRREALELGETVYRDGMLSDTGMAFFARTMAVSAAHLGDVAVAHAWAERVREVVGNPVWADTLLVQLAALDSNAALTLEALERIPTRVVDHKGVEARRVDLARFEVWALWRLGRIQDAWLVAEKAARAGVLPGQPPELWEWLGDEGLRPMLDALTEDAWQLLGVLCTHVASTTAARKILEMMAQARPSDPATLLCASRLVFPHDLGGLEEAAGWSARMRAVGAAELCPLVAVAEDPMVPAMQRARAAALAFFAYEDSRALPALDAALARVAPDDEAELAIQLDVLAPGLVQRV